MIRNVAKINESLETFVTYVRTHLNGDKKAEAADFLDHFFSALGHDGIKEAGASRETRLVKKGGAKGKNYADILTFLLALNQTCAAKEAAGEPITPPVEEHGEFVTGDCIRV